MVNVSLFRCICIRRQQVRMSGWAACSAGRAASRQSLVRAWIHSGITHPFHGVRPYLTELTTLVDRNGIGKTVLEALTSFARPLAAACKAFFGLYLQICLPEDLHHVEAGRLRFGRSFRDWCATPKQSCSVVLYAPHEPAQAADQPSKAARRSARFGRASLIPSLSCIDDFLCDGIYQKNDWDCLLCRFEGFQLAGRLGNALQSGHVIRSRIDYFRRSRGLLSC